MTNSEYLDIWLEEGFRNQPSQSRSIGFSCSGDPKGVTIVVFWMAEKRPFEMRVMADTVNEAKAVIAGWLKKKDDEMTPLQVIRARTPDLEIVTTMGIIQELEALRDRALKMDIEDVRAEANRIVAPINSMRPHPIEAWCIQEGQEFYIWFQEGDKKVALSADRGASA